MYKCAWIPFAAVTMTSLPIRMLPKRFLVITPYWRAYQVCRRFDYFLDVVFILFRRSACDAKNWFVKMWSSMELFGMEFFSSINTETKDSGLIGVSRHKVRWPKRRRYYSFPSSLSKQIMFLFYNTKKKSLMWDYSSLLHWEHVSIPPQSY